MSTIDDTISNSTRLRSPDTRSELERKRRARTIRKEILVRRYARIIQVIGLALGFAGMSVMIASITSRRWIENLYGEKGLYIGPFFVMSSVVFFIPLLSLLLLIFLAVLICGDVRGTESFSSYCVYYEQFCNLGGSIPGFFCSQGQTIGILGISSVISIVCAAIFGLISSYRKYIWTSVLSSILTAASLLISFFSWWLFETIFSASCNFLDGIAPRTRKFSDFTRHDMGYSLAIISTYLFGGSLLFTLPSTILYWYARRVHKKAGPHRRRFRLSEIAISGRLPGMTLSGMPFSDSPVYSSSSDDDSASSSILTSVRERVSKPPPPDSGIATEDEFLEEDFEDIENDYFPENRNKW